jgi:hypothetical protein
MGKAVDRVSVSLDLREKPVGVSVMKEKGDIWICGG